MKSILIVDDHHVNRAFLSLMLSDSYSLLEAENGEQALSLLNELGHSIHAVLLDLIMPVMDGYEFLTHRQKEPFLAQIPVLAFSHSENHNDELRALDLGANDVIQNPYEPALLKQRLHHILYA